MTLYWICTGKDVTASLVCAGRLKCRPSTLCVSLGIFEKSARCSTLTDLDVASAMEHYVALLTSSG